MPKMKSHRGASKRLRMTAKGKFKRRHAFKSHIATPKTAKRTRQLRNANLVDPADHATIRRMLPYNSSIVS